MGSSVGPGFSIDGMPRGPRPPGRPGGPPGPSSFGTWPWPAPGGLASDFGSWADTAGDPAEASPSTAIARSRRDESMVPDSGSGIGTAPYYWDTSDGVASSGP